MLVLVILLNLLSRVIAIVCIDAKYMHSQQILLLRAYPIKDLLCHRKQF